MAHANTLPRPKGAKRCVLLRVGVTLAATCNNRRQNVFGRIHMRTEEEIKQCAQSMKSYKRKRITVDS